MCLIQLNFSFYIGKLFENMRSDTISVFQDEYLFLSNLYLIDLKAKSTIYKSAEHFYQAVRCNDKNDKIKIENAETSKSAKILGRFFTPKIDWDVNKVGVMEKILRLKFRNSRLKRLLRETDSKELINSNHHHDMFWGVCNCTKHQRAGLNMLGKILMKIRRENELKINIKRL